MSLSYLYPTKQERYETLLALQKEGKISDLRKRVKYVLIPTQRDENGKVAEHEVAYYADFVYFDNEEQKTVVEDAKRNHPWDYLLKRTLMLYVHGIRIREPRIK